MNLTYRSPCNATNQNADPIVQDPIIVLMSSQASSRALPAEASAEFLSIETASNPRHNVASTIISDQMINGVSATRLRNTKTTAVNAMTLASAALDESMVRKRSEALIAARSLRFVACASIRSESGEFIVQSIAAINSSGFAGFTITEKPLERRFA